MDGTTEHVKRLLKEWQEADAESKQIEDKLAEAEEVNVPVEGFVENLKQRGL